MSSYPKRRRNCKLGYHRISVACLHCRRRKVRCLVGNDAQGRCEKCIRLRKECKFLPVDQQPLIKNKSRPNSRGENVSTDPSTASSSLPTVSGGKQTEAFFPYHPIPLYSAQDVVAFNTKAFPGNLMTSFAPESTECARTPSLDPYAPWLTTISTAKLGMNMAPNIWIPSPLQDTPTNLSPPQALCLNPVNPQSPSPADLHSVPTPVSYPDQPQVVFPTWHMKNVVGGIW
ncbi:hypothetical protein FE257_003853 [Aspergillus nanangensis]|uniref:Zn(2)-C6 fungal-type domain-containing protein n=1 Tax=Aspergillus nanangensis TaxID=2582783 RepID=A0AAD4GNC7_ASPNN|nr:hypothetical protein FE257_003853 [Aspergillus nanangensis]